MAETAKKRKRTKKAFFDDSDDDFSEPTPQLHQESKPTKLKKKKTDKSSIVYTSTQANLNGSPRRKERLSLDEKRFQKELFDALRLSASDTNSSFECLPGKPDHNPSSADTINIDDILTGSNPEKEGSQRDLEIEEISEKEVIVLDDSQPKPSISPKPSPEKSSAPSTNLEPQSNQNPDLPNLDSKIPVKSKIKKKKPTENWIVQTTGTTLSIAKQKSDAPNPDDDDDFVSGGKDARSGKTEKKPDTEESGKAFKEHESDVSAGSEIKNRNDDDPVLVEKVDSEPESPVKTKRKKKARVLDSDSDSEYGLDTLVKPSRMKEKVNKRGLNPVEELEEIEDKRMEEPEYDKKDDSDLEYSPKKKTRKERKSPKDKNVGKGKENAKNQEEVPNKLEDEKEEEEDEESDEEYSPKKTRKTMKSPPNKRKPGGLTNPVSAPPCLRPNPEVPKPFSKPNSNTANPLSTHSGKMKENESLTPGSDFTKISVTSQPSSKPSSYTPLQSIVKKIPAWTPPARVTGSGRTPGGKGGCSLNLSPGSSPAIGLRLGLSRNIRVSKPLHSNVKKID